MVGGAKNQHLHFLPEVYIDDENVKEEFADFGDQDNVKYSSREGKELREVTYEVFTTEVWPLIVKRKVCQLSSFNGMD